MNLANASGFAALGVAVLGQIGALGNSTKGAFDTPAAGAALAVGTAYLTAGRNAFQALADAAALTLTQRLTVMAVASFFADSLAAIAVSYGPVNTLPSAASLASTDAGPGMALADLFEATAPVITCTTSARDALLGLARDPLELVEDLDSVLTLLGIAVAGVGVAA